MPNSVTNQTLHKKNGKQEEKEISVSIELIHVPVCYVLIVITEICFDTNNSDFTVKIRSIARINTILLSYL